MPVLFEHPLSPYAQKVKISLREKGVDFDVRMPDGIGSGAAGEIFLRANPRAEVPALIDGEAAIFDSTIILEYVEDKWPSPAMLPKNPAARANARMLEEICDTQYEAINWGLGEIGYFRRAEGELAAQIQERAAEQTANLHIWLTRKLGDWTWFNGDIFGWGDLSVAPYVNASASFGLGPEAGTPLAAWLDRVRARTSCAKTFEESASVAPAMENVAEAVRQGHFKREYRDHRLEWMIRSGGLQVVLDGLKADNIRFSNELG